MITTFNQTRGAVPTTLSPVEIALEAGVTNERATAMIAACWPLAETFTGRNYFPVTGAVAIANVPEGGGEACWPRAPFPEALTMEFWTGLAWFAATNVFYLPEDGGVTGLAEGRYKFTQEGTVTPTAPAGNVLEAVRALALYQLVHSPARREFRQINAGDSSLTREALDGLFRASGAGILLAGEVRW
ncbi:hypothetical protein [Pseudotabrizicola alkalilacus]|uniref:Uncharacterized protein n=1 Tax=Pseudotabrizicola alkalilacus TaxID=2305252 RepID=A0A411Z877_9RHOB|nr:hypothetical protein [Pseudotabrizicola alkalilacus]RGP39236.1 hypothetical protein D1012_03795 [Pseudotabrizicola alkalilacus]